MPRATKLFPSLFRVLSSLLLFPAISSAEPLALHDGGRVIVRSDVLGASWSLRLPTATKEAHAVRSDLIVVQEANRMRVIVGGAPGSSEAARLRTLPLQLREPTLQQVSEDAGQVVFESGSSREEVDIGGLANGDFRSTVRTRGAPSRSVDERLATPVTRVFWNPQRPAGFVGPGHGNRMDVVTAFSSPRPNEMLDEYEPYDCALPLHYAGRNWEPSRAHVFEHTLRDRKGSTQIFFTATESGDVTYLTAAEAAVRGCEASYRRHLVNMARSYDQSQKLDSEEYVVRVELLDHGVPAEGVIVRLREVNEGSRQSCSEPNLGRPRLELSSTDGFTLADGTYAWKLWHRRHRTSGRTRSRIRLDITQGVAATLCVRVDGSWLPVWHSPDEKRGYLLRCDLAAPEAERCHRLE